MLFNGGSGPVIREIEGINIIPVSSVDIGPVMRAGSRVKIL